MYFKNGLPGIHASTSFRYLTFFLYNGAFTRIIIVVVFVVYILVNLEHRENIVICPLRHSNLVQFLCMIKNAYAHCKCIDSFSIMKNMALGKILLYSYTKYI